jgi:hypothetical protein
MRLVERIENENALQPTTSGFMQAGVYTRRNICGSRRCAKPLGRRWLQVSESALTKTQRFERLFLRQKHIDLFVTQKILLLRNKST